MNPVRVSRRRLLTLAGLSVGIGAISLTLAEPADADPAAGPHLRLLGDHPRQVLPPAGGQSTWYPRLLAVEVVRDAALPAGTVVTIDFDSRLYVAADRPTATLDGRPLPATARFTDARTCTVTITSAVPAGGQLVVHVADARTRLYPHDLIADPTGTAGAVRGARNDLRPAAPNSRQTALPWGVELYTAWGRQDWGTAGEFSYPVPVKVSLRGTGPGQAVHPASFAVTVDPQLVDHLTVADVRLNRGPLPGGARPAGEQHSAGRYTTRWRTSVLLGARDVLDIALLMRPLTPNGALETVTHPVVTLWDMGADVAQRQTGHSSSSRLDSIW